uniref:Uncharacterized protein n=1 Tax=Anguilla anguilla TaxID=7936 RepID=A0A0E9SJN1_ANGAN
MSNSSVIRHMLFDLPKVCFTKMPKHFPLLLIC